jgi:hypothetical protein
MQFSKASEAIMKKIAASQMKSDETISMSHIKRNEK